MGAISGGMATSSLWKVPTMGLGGGVSSEIMGGQFKDGFKVAFVTAAAAYLYSSVSSKYNTNNGKPHAGQNGRSDVGKALKKNELAAIERGEMAIPKTSDQYSGMKWVGKNVYYADAFAGFHDLGFNEFLRVPGDQVSLIATMPPSYALTVTAAFEPYTHTYLIEKNVRRGNM